MLHSYFTDTVSIPYPYRIERYVKLSKGFTKGIDRYRIKGFIYQPFIERFIKPGKKGLESLWKAFGKLLERLAKPSFNPVTWAFPISHPNFPQTKMRSQTCLPPFFLPEGEQVRALIFRRRPSFPPGCRASCRRCGSSSRTVVRVTVQGSRGMIQSMWWMWHLQVHLRRRSSSSSVE